MDKQTLVATCCVLTMVALAGCSMVPGGGGTAAFTVDVQEDSVNDVVVGDDFTVTGTVENTGDAAGNHTLTLQANGETVATKTVELSPGESTTVRLTHTAETTGDHTLQLGQDEITTTAHSPIDSITATMNQTTTYSATTTTNTKILATDTGDGPISIDRTETTTGHYDLTAQRAQVDTESTVTVDAIDFEINTEGHQIYADDVLYTQSKSGDNRDGGPLYQTQDKPFTTLVPVSNFESLTTRLDDDSVSVTDDSLVYTVEGTDEGYLADIVTIIGEDESFLDENDVTESTMEIMVDRQTHRISSLTITMKTESTNTAAMDGSKPIPEDTEHMTKTIEHRVEFTAYNDPITVDIPAETTPHDTTPTPLVRAYELEGNTVPVEAVSMDTATEIIVKVEGTERARLTADNPTARIDNVSAGDEIVIYANSPTLDNPVQVESTTAYRIE